METLCDILMGKFVIFEDVIEKNSIAWNITFHILDLYHMKYELAFL